MSASRKSLKPLKAKKRNNVPAEWVFDQVQGGLLGDGSGEPPCCFFNMSRTLSIGNNGPRAVGLALGPVYLGRNPRGTARVWFDARSAV